MDPGLTLPLSKVRKIIKLDPEHVSATEGATFLLAMATELFVMDVTHEASLVTKSMRRRKIMYQDFQKAVAAGEKYAFVRDIVPKRAPLGELVQRGQLRLDTEDAARIQQSIAQDGVQDMDEVLGELPENPEDNEENGEIPTTV